MGQRRTRLPRLHPGPGGEQPWPSPSVLVQALARQARGWSAPAPACSAGAGIGAAPVPGDRQRPGLLPHQRRRGQRSGHRPGAQVGPPASRRRATDRRHCPHPWTHPGHPDGCEAGAAWPGGICQGAVQRPRRHGRGHRRRDGGGDAGAGAGRCRGDPGDPRLPAWHRAAVPAARRPVDPRRGADRHRPLRRCWRRNCTGYAPTSLPSARASAPGCRCRRCWRVATPAASNRATSLAPTTATR